MRGLGGLLASLQGATSRINGYRVVVGVLLDRVAHWPAHGGEGESGGIDRVTRVPIEVFARPPAKSVT
jgi:hypothetical protein